MTTEIENNGKIGKVFLEKAIENETYKQIKHMVGHEGHSKCSCYA